MDRQYLDQQTEAGRYEIPGLLALYVYYAVYILMHDWICYLGGFDTTVWTYLGAAFVFTLFAVIFSIWNGRTRSFRFCMPKISRWDLLVFAAYLFMFFIRVGRADAAFDTWNYHLIHQENPFRDFIGYDFLPANRESYFPALADRMYYPFRLLLGYRMGTIFYTLLMILTYLGVKQLVYKGLSVEKMTGGKQEAFVSIACGAALVTNFVEFEICSYYVDLFPLPLMLYLICEISDGVETDRRGDPFLALCAGIIFALKMSYAFLLLPLGVAYIWENRKRIRSATILCFGFLGILPIMVYLLNAWEQTGNPVFPLYNTFFHSPYITDQQNEVMDPGVVTGLFEGLLRPFRWAVISSGNGYNAQSDCRITIGFVSSLILLVFPIGEQTARRHIRRIAGLHIAMVYLTVFFIYSYPRVGLIIEPFGGAMATLLIALCWRSVKLPHLHGAVGGVVAVLLGISTAYSASLYLTDFFEYSWEYPVYSIYGARTRNGLPLLFRDRGCTKEERELAAQVDVWLNFDTQAGAMLLLNDNAPIVNVRYASLDSKCQSAAEQLLRQYSTDGLYTLLHWNNISEILKHMTNLGYHVTGEVQSVQPYFSNYRFYLIHVEKSEEENNYAILTDSAPTSTREIEEARTTHGITGYAGLDCLTDTWDVAWQPITLRFSLLSGEAKTILAETTVEPDFEFHALDLPCTAEVNPGDQLIVEALNPDGYPYGYLVDLMNIALK